MSEEIVDELHAALAAAQGEMPNAVFNRENPHFKSRYADLGAIRDATQAALSKHGLSLNHETQLLEDGRMLLTGILSHGKSGQQQRTEWLITATTPQGRGSELTYGRRYTASMLTGVATEEDDDGNLAQASKPKRGASDIALGEGQATLSKAQSRKLYETLILEVRAIVDKEKLNTWGLENADRIHQMHADYQKWFLTEFKDRRTAIIEGVDENGDSVRDESEFKRKLRESLDDEIPAEGGGDEVEGN